MMENKCEECGKLYPVPKCRVDESRFCVRDCFNAYRKKHPKEFARKSLVKVYIKDPSRKFSDMTITLIASNQLRDKPVIQIADICGWYLPRFMQQMEVNKERIDKRKRCILDRRKQSAKQWVKRYSGSYSDKFSSAHTGQRIDKI